MSVVGFDIGNDGCFVAEIKRGGVDMVLNENSNRRTPNLVSIQQGNRRLTGEQAGSIAKSNYMNTVASVKPYIGRPYKACAEELQTLPVKAVEMADGSVGWEVNYNEEPTVFSCQQVLSMVLSDLCRTVQKSRADGKGVRDVVIAVPGYFVESQRLAIIDACTIAGVQITGLINEMTAIALGYGIWKSARNCFHESEAQNVMFVDVGYRSTSVCVASFVQGKLTIRSCAYNVNQGSATVDMAIVKEMAAQYLDKHPGENPMTKPKAVIKMKAAADKAKKTISPEGVNLASITIECLMGDYDLNYKLDLKNYEEMVSPFLDQLEVPIVKTLTDAGMKPSDIHCVEIVGGGSRIKGVKQRISKVMELNTDVTNFGVSTTMNADEAVARGCALMCAMRSPRFSVKPFSVTDVAQFPITVQYDPAALGVSFDVQNEDNNDEIKGMSSNGALAIVAEGTGIPAPKTLTVELKNGQDEFELHTVIPECDEPLKYSAFVVEGEGMQVDGQSSLNLMQYVIKVNGETKQPVKLAVKHDRNGILEILPQDDQVSVAYQSVGKLETDKIAELTALEQTMSAKDEAIQMTADKKNELESFVYAFRDELCGELSEFLVDAEKTAANTSVQSAEDWLYSDEGFDATLKVYSEKLQELQAVKDKPVRRKTEDQERPAAVDSLVSALAKYDAMAEDPRDSARVKALHMQVNTWLQDLKAQQEPLPKTADPILTVSAVRAKTKLIECLQRQVSSLAELRKAIAGSFVLECAPGASSDVFRNLTEEDIRLLQAEAQKVKQWLDVTVDGVTEFALPEKEDGRPSPSSTEVDQKKEDILCVEDQAKAMSELRSKIIEVRALKASSVLTDAATMDPASTSNMGPHTYAGLYSLTDGDWKIVASECDVVVEWVTSKANVDSIVPSAVEIRKRVNGLESVVKKAGCVSTLRSNINKYSTLLETQKEADQYKHVTTEGWGSLQAAIDEATSYVRDNLEGRKDGMEVVPPQKFPEIQDTITSANDALCWAAEDALFSLKQGGNRGSNTGGSGLDLD